MRFVRFHHGGQVRHGLLEDGRVRELLRAPFDGATPMATTHALEAVELLAPTRPSKMVCVGVNYRDHAAEMGHTMPEEPVIFMKPSSALCGPGEPIEVPPGVGRVDYEAELAVVVGRAGRDIPEDAADDYVLGYTCFNDVTARDLQARDGQWTRAKGFDTFGVVGPWIETDPGEVADLEVVSRLNGEVRQRSRTSQLAFGPRALVAWVSRVMTLWPGDVIATGTPAGVGPMEPGDTIEVEVEGVGLLRNPVAAAPEAHFAPRRVR